MPKDLFEEHGIDLLANNKRKEEEPGFLSNLGHGYLNFFKGLNKGVAQDIGDLGASVINAPISGIEYLSGHHIPHVPHPHLTEHPESMGESFGQTLGQLFGTVALPGGAGMKAAQLANKGYQSLRAGQKLPLIARLLAGGAGGAAEGALGNEENRVLGAELGGALGAAGHAVPSVINFAKSMSSKNIAKDISNTMQKLNENFNDRFTTHLIEGEKAGANDFLRPQRGNVSILKKAGETGEKKGEKGLTYALEKYNENPSLTNAHIAQRDLGKIERLHKGAPPGSLEDAAYKEALKLKNRLLQQISESFEKSGAKQHGLDYQKTRADYATEYVPYSESKAISDLLGKNKQRTQTLRPGKFADKLLQEEKFLSRSGKEHSGLMRREKVKSVLENPFANKALAGAAIVGGGYLPYEIAKLLGLK
jgi:hypothetical protein